MSYKQLTLALTFITSATFANTALAHSNDSQSAIKLELTAFANASCLAKQSNPLLSEQGYLWANSILEANTSYDFETVLMPINTAVEESLAILPMPVVTGDSNPEEVKGLPIAYCFDMSQSSTIQAVIKDLAATIKD